MSSGRQTGSWSSGNGTSPQLLQNTMGIGHPQYLCLDTPQSRILYVTVSFPIPNFCNSLILKSTASFVSNPFKKSELMCKPSPV